MSHTYIISGPKSAEPQARTALAAGYAVLDTVHDHGLPEHPQGKKAKQPVAFITVTGEPGQLDEIRERAETVGYRLRMHHETPPPEPEDELAATLADMQRQIDELRGKVG